MHKIDCCKWGEFQIKDIFVTENKKQVLTGASISRSALVEGETPRISATNINNGIIGYYDDVKDKNYRVFENFISVSFLGAVFYHPYKASLDMKIHCLKLREKELNKYIAFYLISVIRKQIEWTEYKDQISSTVLPNITIKLPVIEPEKPDREYMENFVKSLESRERERVYTLFQLVCTR